MYESCFCRHAPALSLTTRRRTSTLAKAESEEG
jgi:hypothetical protein